MRPQLLFAVAIALLLGLISTAAATVATEGVTVSICGLNAGNDCSSNCTKYKVGSDECLSYSGLPAGGHFLDGTSMFKCQPPKPYGYINGVLFAGSSCSTRDYPQNLTHNLVLGSCNIGQYFNAVNNSNGTVSIQSWACDWSCQGRQHSPYAPPSADLNCTLLAEGPVGQCIPGYKTAKYGVQSYIFTELDIQPRAKVIDIYSAGRNNFSCTDPVCSDCFRYSFPPTPVLQDQCVSNSFNTKKGSHFSVTCDTSKEELARLPSLNMAPKADVVEFSKVIRTLTANSRRGGKMN